MSQLTLAEQLVLLAELANVDQKARAVADKLETVPGAAKKADEVIAKYKVREEGPQKIPVVKPPAGSDVYLVARLWSWQPILELEAGKSYRIHLMSMDWLHGFSLQPENINIQVHPGYDHVLTVTPTNPGKYAIICNEYCGINHHTMLSPLYVVK